MNLSAWLQTRMLQLSARLPARFQQGKMPYVFFFAVMVIVVLLTYAVILTSTGGRCVRLAREGKL